LEKERSLKVAIVHDYLRTFGGGERVLEALCDIWPKARVFVATADFKRMGIFAARFRKLGIRTSWAQKIPFFVKKPLLYRFSLPLVWSFLDVGKVDVVISSSGSNISKGVRIPKGAIHICYCHTPPRFLYSLKTETDILNNPILKVVAGPAVAALKYYDKKTSKNVDLFIANSQNVKERIKRAYNKDALVIYPPCRLPKSLKNSKKGSDYLVVSRLVRYKNVDLIIRAFNSLKLPLRIIGAGKEGSKLRELALGNVQFLDEVPDARLYREYAGCKALVLATQDEDFGMTASEVMGYGKPVIAYYSGGYKEAVKEGITGIFFRRLTIASISSAIKKFEEKTFNPETIRRYATRFSEQEFKKRIKKAVLGALRKKKEVARIHILDKVPFDAITERVLIEKILHFQKKKLKKLVLNMNTYGVVTFLKNKRYARIIKSADLIYPDGWGPIWASRFSKGKLPERVNVGDFIDELLRGMNKAKLGIYLLGCDDNTIKKTLKTIQRKYPVIRICGGNSGFFDRKKEREIIKEIRAARPNLVLVGMGIPTQEYFINRNWKALPPAVYMGVGGVFYYISGLKSRAPKFMRQWGLEWIYRLGQEPTRLWKRYTLDNLYFGYVFLKSLLRGRTTFTKVT
jgi:exopolysaccharide biosynthesis WecB/TagA/CpsF family protein